MRKLGTVIAITMASFAATSTVAEQGISDTEVRFAQVAAMEGPASALGQGMNLGIAAAFAEANANGGVHGRSLTLESMNDGYEPNRSIEAVTSVISSNNYLALIGPVGTPTTRATQPLATEANMPMIGPFTGAGFLRDPALTNVLNLRATYDAETAAWIDHLVDEMGYNNIAILYQDDGFGRVGLAGVKKALDARGMELTAEGTYTRNTVAVKSALLSIRKAKPEAIVMVGAYKPLAEFIKLSQKMGMDPTFVTISFVGSKALATELGEAGDGVIVSQVVPNPWDTAIPVVASYHAALKAHDASAEPGFVSFEGYLTGRVAIEALRSAGRDLSRDALLSAIEGLGAIDFGGFSLSYGPGDNQGSDGVFLTRINADGSFEPVSPSS
ncbi:MAG: ABC transporter substrate-binding protein [Pseudomonadota bacterium]